MFITLEGIDGSGKSTQSERLSEWLTLRTGRQTVRTFEPGGHPDGAALRRFILESRNYSPKSELLLFLADRAEHVDKVIAPALLAGDNVICERWNESTLAYQCGGHKIDIPEAERLIAACNFPEPDAKIFLDISPELAVSRIIARKNLDKFESEGFALMKRVSEFYRQLADSGKLMRIDCESLNENKTFSAITSELERSRIWRSR